MKNKRVYRRRSSIKNNIITIHGCGKFQETSMSLNKLEAKLLYLELHKFVTEDMIDDEITVINI